MYVWLLSNGCTSGLGSICLGTRSGMMEMDATGHRSRVDAAGHPSTWYPNQGGGWSPLPVRTRLVTGPAVNMDAAGHLSIKTKLYVCMVASLYVRMYWDVC